MRKAIIATVCGAICTVFIGGISMASAQTTGQPGQDSMRTNSAMNAQNKMMMKKKKMKKGMMKSGDDMSGMKKDDMGGMKK